MNRDTGSKDSPNATNLLYFYDMDHVVIKQKFPQFFLNKHFVSMENLQIKIYIPNETDFHNIIHFEHTNHDKTKFIIIIMNHRRTPNDTFHIRIKVVHVSNIETSKLLSCNGKILN